MYRLYKIAVFYSIIFVGLIDHVTILIGVCVNDDAVAGVIYQPFWKNCGKALWGLVGSGIGGLELKEPTQNNKVYVTSRSHYDKSIETFIDGLKPCEIIRVGGAGNKVESWFKKKKN